MKKLLAITAAVLALASTPAAAWTTRGGHWIEGPRFVAPYSPASPLRYGPPLIYAPAYGGPGLSYGYDAPVIVAPPPTDAQVIAGAALGIASMFAR